ncbi:hypothetical protein ILYODFUR_013567 [Ilyodon furcidens]|uniref:Uncharacterized protein n=1 Tax=Ilyodon furcidens TaxID=33524 RepID=A0ABV0VF08_9TELE
MKAMKLAGCDQQVRPHTWSSSSPIRRSQKKSGSPEANAKFFCSKRGNQAFTSSLLHVLMCRAYPLSPSFSGKEFPVHIPRFQFSAILLSQSVEDLTSRSPPLISSPHL